MTNQAPSDENASESEAGPTLNPKIAHHGAYIKETKQLLREYARVDSFDSLKRRVVDDNILNKSTDEYRTNILREIARRYLPEQGEHTAPPLVQVVTADVRDDVADWCIYYEFSQDPFIRLLTVEYLYPEYERGMLAVHSESVFEFLQAEKDEYPILQERADSTVMEAARKYLAALKNFGLLEGTQRKEFSIIHVPDEVIAYVVYRLFDRGVDTASEVIGHDDWKLFLMDEEDVRRRLRDISPTYVQYEKRGSTERLKRSYDTIGGLIDAV